MPPRQPPIPRDDPRSLPPLARIPFRPRADLTTEQLARQNERDLWVLRGEIESIEARLVERVKEELGYAYLGMEEHMTAHVTASVNSAMAAAMVPVQEQLSKIAGDATLIREALGIKKEILNLREQEARVEGLEIDNDLKPQIVIDKRIDGTRSSRNTTIATIGTLITALGAAGLWSALSHHC